MYGEKKVRVGGKETGWGGAHANVSHAMVQLGVGMVAGNKKTKQGHQRQHPERQAQDMAGGKKSSEEPKARCPVQKTGRGSRDRRQ